MQGQVPWRPKALYSATCLQKVQTTANTKRVVSRGNCRKATRYRPSAPRSDQSIASAEGGRVAEEEEAAAYNACWGGGESWRGGAGCRKRLSAESWYTSEGRTFAYDHTSERPPIAYDHTTLNIRELVRSRKSSSVGPGQYLDRRRLGNPRKATTASTLVLKTIQTILAYLELAAKIPWFRWIRFFWPWSLPLAIALQPLQK
uniref:Uncharacterized protein n=1 Tax=Steinernema glaseri TaxID=37863 RepID=A0A1I8ALV4_9BILA